MVAILLSLALSPAAFLFGRSTGRQQAQAEMSAKLSLATIKANNEYRELEQAHARKIAELQEEYAKQAANEKSVDAVVVHDFSDGAQRMRFAVRNCEGYSAKATKPTERIDGARTAELSPETAAALYTIAADGDRAARKLTALQAWVKEAVNLCNGGQHD